MNYKKLHHGEPIDEIYKDFRAILFVDGSQLQLSPKQGWELKEYIEKLFHKTNVIERAENEISGTDDYEKVSVMQCVTFGGYEMEAEVVVGFEMTREAYSGGWDFPDEPAEYKGEIIEINFM